MADDTFLGTETQDMHDTIGGRISRAREAGGLTTNELARRIGVKNTTMQSWENDRSEPRSNKLVMLSGVLNVSPSWLIMGDGEAPGVETSGDDTVGEIAHELRQLHDQAADLKGRIATLLTRLDNRSE